MSTVQETIARALEDKSLNRELSYIQGFSYTNCTMVRDVLKPVDQQVLWRGEPGDEKALETACRQQRELRRAFYIYQALERAGYWVVGPY